MIHIEVLTVDVVGHRYKCPPPFCLLLNHWILSVKQIWINLDMNTTSTHSGKFRYANFDLAA